MKVTDQTHYTFELKQAPRRIVSLVPSQSELLWDLGLCNEIVGITKFCVHPHEMFYGKERIGGTKQFSIDKIRALNPDLIIGNKEENDKTQIEELRSDFPVWLSDVNTLEDAYQMIGELGYITGKTSEAEGLISSIQNEFSKLKSHLLKGKSAAYFMWFDPVMAAANHTFINAMLEACLLINVFSHQSRYPQVTAAELKKANPDFILLSSEPYPFRETHIAFFKSICPNAKVILVDGEMFSWYGSRLQKSPLYFSDLFKTELQ